MKHCLPVVLLVMLLGVALGAGAVERIVTNPLGAGDGSLRYVMQSATSGDVIRFDPVVFPPTSPVSIPLGAPLPELDIGGITVDASDAGVILDGTGLAPDEAALVLVSSGNVIRGLQFANCPAEVLIIKGNASNNVIGGDPTVGSDPSGQGIVICNCGTGILIEGDGASGNEVSGSFIGTARTGRGKYGNEIGVRIRLGAHDNQIGPSNFIAYSEIIAVEIEDSSYNTVGPSNTILDNFLPAIRIVGAAIGNVITQNTLRTTGSVRGYNTVSDDDCRYLGTCTYAGVIEVEETSQGGILPPRITVVDASAGVVAGETCSHCAVELFSGGLFTPYAYEGTALADGTGQYRFEKGAALSERTLFLTATDAERGTSAAASPLCRDSYFPAGANPGEIRIMSYNIFHRPAVPEVGKALFDWETLPAEEWETASHEWKDFIELLEYANADILALQETQIWATHDHLIFKAVAERLGYPYVTLPTGLLSVEEEGPSAAIFSRFEIVDYEQNGIGNGNMRADILLPDGQLLHVFNVHIKNCSSQDPDHSRQLPQLLEWIAGYEELPSVVLGDFNANLTGSSGSDCIGILRQHGWTLVSDNWSQRIPADSIWVSSMLATLVRSSSAVTSCAAKAGYEISDHTPVMMLMTTSSEE